MAELAGLALGVPPLLIAAIQSYHRVTTFFSTIKDYPRKLREAINTLRMQELCFRKANQKILCQCVDSREATQMLWDASHPAWSEQSVSSRYIEFLGGDLNTFEVAIDLICNRLDTVQADFEQLLPNPKTSIEAARKRFDFAFKQSRITDSLRDLTEKTQNFIGLINLMIPQAPSYDTSRRRVSPVGLRKEIQRSAAVKKTAEDLYGALGAACTEHENHQVHLSLIPVCSNAQQIRFTLAFSEFTLTPPGPGTGDKSLWLTVESSFNERSGSSDGETDGLCQVTTLKRTFVRFQDEYDEHSSQSNKAKRPLQQQNQQKAAGLTSLMVTPPVPSPASTIVNLCTNGKICHHLARFVNLTLPRDQAIGYLKKSAISKHLIYLECDSSATSAKSGSTNLRSLRDVLREDRGDTTHDGFSFAQRITLAKQLAQAVLHFHKTAWLQDSWDSRTILVRRSKGPRAPTSNADSALEVFATTNIYSPTANYNLAPTSPNPLVIRNRLLFSLGVVLIELAYEKPLASMIDQIDRIGTAQQDVPYRTADRLSKRVSRWMGPMYAETVHKCLHCDFGQGFDFEEAKLQEAFYQSIVCELGKLGESLG